MSKPGQDPSPFASQEAARATIPLWMLFVSMIVFAFISLLFMFAARVPAISDGLNDLFGITRNASQEKVDRSSHLFMLLFCYASPLLLLFWVSLLQRLFTGNAIPARRRSEPDADNPFSDGES